MVDPDKIQRSLPATTIQSPHEFHRSYFVHWYTLHTPAMYQDKELKISNIYPCWWFFIFLLHQHIQLATKYWRGDAKTQCTQWFPQGRTAILFIKLGRVKGYREASEKIRVAQIKKLLSIQAFEWQAVLLSSVFALILAEWMHCTKHCRKHEQQNCVASASSRSKQLLEVWLQLSGTSLATWQLLTNMTQQAPQLKNKFM